MEEWVGAGLSQLWLEVRKGPGQQTACLALPHHPPFSEEPAWVGGALGQGKGLFKELHTVGCCRSSPRNTREEALWVSATPFPGFSRAAGRVTPGVCWLAVPLQGCVRLAPSCHLTLQKLEVHFREAFLIHSAILNTQDHHSSGRFSRANTPEWLS